MAERTRAEDRLSRILYLIPAAAREGGALLEDLAAELDARPSDILADLQEYYEREFYHPAGTVSDATVTIEGDRVSIWTKGELRRPARFTRRETAALGLGLRAMAMESVGDSRDELLRLAERLEGSIGKAEPEDVPPVLMQTAAADPRELNERLAEAARERRRCRITYLKSGSDGPEDRTVEPYALLVSEGKRYLVAYCREREGTRVFRVDRMLGVEVGEEHFELPAGFDLAGFVTNGRVYAADQEIEVTVRYSARVANWIRERGPVQEEEDGSVRVVHSVADPEWVVRHVLQYGADAEIAAPTEVRQLVREAAQRLLLPS